MVSEARKICAFAVWPRYRGRMKNENALAVQLPGSLAARTTFYSESSDSLQGSSNRSRAGTRKERKDREPHVAHNAFVTAGTWARSA